ncbi:FAD-binding protein [Deltaproteobacteria bacterium TL4]
MKATLELILSLDQAEDPSTQRQLLAEQLNISPEQITAVRLIQRSIDSRKNKIRVCLKFEVFWEEPAPQEIPITKTYPKVLSKRQVVIVGSGPAGMFAALRLIELGIKPVIVERGKNVRARRKDLVAIQTKGLVNADSNYCFGEGGAGTYSDGKLYTRATKRGNVETVLRTLIAHGASPDILVDTHPHIGSNKLPAVVVAMRKSIVEAGGEFWFENRVNDLILDPQRRIRGVVSLTGNRFEGEAVILATGHSARDVFELLRHYEIALEAKPFAMGVRVEHPQPLIDQIQYHKTERDPRLPAASYRLAETVQGRGVFSFCMCPGGFIVPAATAPDEVVVNGMSLSRQDSPYANAGIVVSVELADLEPYQEHGPLAGVIFQKGLEHLAFQAGGCQLRAPAQRLTDFLEGHLSPDLPPCSYKPGLSSAPLHELLPVSLVSRLQEGFRRFEHKMRGYVTKEAVILGVESRTSTPTRIPRDPQTLEHPQIPGLYPCGEGSGYAGGIVSAAMDGIRVADACHVNVRS